MKTHTNGNGKKSKQTEYHDPNDLIRGYPRVAENGQILMDVKDAIIKETEALVAAHGGKLSRSSALNHACFVHKVGPRHWCKTKTWIPGIENWILRGQPAGCYHDPGPPETEPEPEPQDDEGFSIMLAEQRIEHLAERIDAQDKRIKFLEDLLEAKTKGE